MTWQRSPGFANDSVKMVLDHETRVYVKVDGSALLLCEPLVRIRMKFSSKKEAMKQIEEAFK